MGRAAPSLSPKEPKAKETQDGSQPKKAKEKINEIMDAHFGEWGAWEQVKRRKPNKPNKRIKDKPKKPSSCHTAFFTKAVAFASNKFSVEMYKEILRKKSPREEEEFLLGLFRSSGKSPRNLVMSAFSVFTVLSMLRVGAQGKTKKQITKELTLPGPRVAKC